jgi:hypothetical protein
VSLSRSSYLFDLLSQLVVLLTGRLCLLSLVLSGGVAGANRYQEKRNETEPRQHSFQLVFSWIKIRERVISKLA